MCAAFNDFIQAQAMDALCDRLTTASINIQNQEQSKAEIKKAATSLKIPPATLLQHTFDQHGEDLLNLINPKLRDEILQLVGNNDPTTTTTMMANINNNQNRFWNWLITPRNRELIKARTMASVLKTMMCFCEPIVLSNQNLECLCSKLQDCLSVSNEAMLTPHQYQCLMSCSKVRKQHPILSMDTCNDLNSLTQRVYPQKNVLKPVAFAETTISNSIVPKFLGKKGKNIKEIQKFLQNSCPGNIVVNITLIEDKTDCSSAVVAGAWQCDEDVSKRLANRTKLSEEEFQRLSLLFFTELRNSVKKLQLQKRGSVQRTVHRTDRVQSWSLKRPRC
mmetsp:Transcript_10487/g.12760  ORF Transcript_10487/g.12760 Transcript_10487/m.12760 type:complete len:334 (-) Transcript_10487:74-1075(-)